MPTSSLTHVDLFSGIGACALAAEWAGFDTVAYCEINDFNRRVLRKNFGEGITIHEDIRSTSFVRYRGVHLLTGGFPCQPFSASGRKDGQKDDRYLWPQMFRAIAEARPAYIVGENVAHFFGMADGLDRVLSDLASEGYEALPFSIPACGVGAWHRRERWFVIAADAQSGLWRPGLCEAKALVDRTELGYSASLAAPRRRNQTRTAHDGRQEGELTPKRDERIDADPGLELGRESWARQLAYAQRQAKRTYTPLRSDHWSTWEHQPLVGRDLHGAAPGLDVSTRRNRCRALGEACPPQQYFPVFAAIAKELRRG